MTLKDFNPLEHFKELSTVPKVLLLFGVVIVFAGLATGISFYNPVLIFGATLILLALTLNTFQKGIGNNPHPPHNFLLDWEKMLGGTILLLITGVTLMWFLQITFKENAPPFVKVFWNWIVSIVWKT